jgi:zinc protease
MDFIRFENKVQALTPEAVNAAMRKYFDPSKLILIYAGDFLKKAL